MATFTDTANAPADMASVKEDFLRRLQREQTALQEQMNRLKDGTLQELDQADLVAQCQNTISRMSNDVKNASSYLPAYDQRTCSTAIKNLRDKLQETRTASAPKRRFAFRKPVPQREPISGPDEGIKGGKVQGRGFPYDSPPATTSIQVHDDAISPSIQAGHEATVTSPAQSRALDFSNPQAITISSIFHSRYVLATSSIHHGSSASVMDVRHSVIDFSTPTNQAETFKTMTIRSVSESLLLCGRVNGAVHITKVDHGTLVVNSRQVRIHKCKDCVFYLRCTSRPIIEDCEDIRFAPIPAVYDVDYSDFSDPSDFTNMWDQVDDFRWLRTEHSPNWSILNPNDDSAVDTEAWHEIAAGMGANADLDDILRTARVIK